MPNLRLDAALQLAGLTRPTDRKDPLARLFADEPARTAPARVWLTESEEGLAIDWEDSDGATPARNEGVLSRFVRLAQATDEAICAFAGQYGVLNLCKAHALGAAHLGRWADPDKAKPWEPKCPVYKPEPVVLWRIYSIAFGSLLTIAADLHRGRRGNPRDWGTAWAVVTPGWLANTDPDLYTDVDATLVLQTMFALGDLGFEEVWKATAPAPLVAAEARRLRITPAEYLMQHERRWLGNFTDALLRSFRVRPALHWEGTALPTIGLVAPDLMSALARELAFVIARVDGLALCHGCGSPFVPRRKPRADQRSWCDECRGTADIRQAQRDRRERLAVRKRGSSSRAGEEVDGSLESQRP